MAGQAQNKDPEARIMLGLLESVARDGDQSQRHLATELDVALGLVNAYLRRCIKKGLVKVSGVPARRYAYYLTPKGFAEKSRLTVEYLSTSFEFFRQAKADCATLLESARLRNLTRLVLAGRSDLAEIAAICALETGVEIAAVVDAKSPTPQFLGLPVAASFDDIDGIFDAVIVTDLLTPQETVASAVARLGADRVLIPNLLRTEIDDRRKARA
ncbi:MAG: winged helix-turn-helix transcriptional regulator [Pseudolabrys sp.]